MYEMSTTTCGCGWSSLPSPSLFVNFPAIPNSLVLTDIGQMLSVKDDRVESNSLHRAYANENGGISTSLVSRLLRVTSPFYNNSVDRHRISSETKNKEKKRDCARDEPMSRDTGHRILRLAGEMSIVYPAKLFMFIWWRRQCPRKRGCDPAGQYVCSTADVVVNE